jgi:hypothetical protein
MMFAFAWYSFGVITGAILAAVVMYAKNVPPIDKDKM